MLPKGQERNLPWGPGFLLQPLFRCPEPTACGQPPSFIPLSEPSSDWQPPANVRVSAQCAGAEEGLHTASPLLAEISAASLGACQAMATSSCEWQGSGPVVTCSLASSLQHPVLH